VISYISFEYVLTIHDELIAEYGGAKGILHEGLLRSALEMPKARFNGKDLHRTIFDKEPIPLIRVRRFSEDFWPFFDSFSGGNINLRI